MSGGAPLPVIRLEIESMREHVQHAMIARSEEFNEMVAAELERQMGLEGFTRLVETAVAKAITKSVEELVDCYQLRRVIQSHLVEQISAAIRGGGE